MYDLYTHIDLLLVETQRIFKHLVDWRSQNTTEPFQSDY